METITLSPAEAQLFLRTIEDAVAFAQAHAFEFQAYCNPERFQSTLRTLAEAEKQTRAQLQTTAAIIRIPGAALTAALDLAECLSAAKTARVANAQLALYASIAGGLAAWLLGVAPLSAAGSAAAVGILLFGPSIRAANAAPELVNPEAPAPKRLGNPNPAEPKATWGAATQKTPLLGSLGVPALGTPSPELGAPVLGAKPRNNFLERVIVSDPQERHHWGAVSGPVSGPEAAVCLAGPKYLIRVEGFAGMEVSPAPAWRVAPLVETRAATKAAAVWAPGLRAASRWGPVPLAKPGSFWVAYTGPFCETPRVAGPFG